MEDGGEPCACHDFGDTKKFLQSRRRAPLFDQTIGSSRGAIMFALPSYETMFSDSLQRRAASSAPTSPEPLVPSSREVLPGC